MQARLISRRHLRAIRTRPLVWWTIALLAIGLSNLDVLNGQEAGGFVLLRNGNVLPGQARRDGKFFDIQRGDESEIRVPADQVVTYGATLEDLYAFRQANRPPNSLSASLADIGWALDHGLLDTAAREVERLRRLVPNDPRFQAIDLRLRNARQQQQERLADSLANALGVVQASFDAPLDPPAGRQAAEVLVPDAAESLPSTIVAHYTSRIQPLLINRCGQAACHGGHSTAQWQIDHFGTSIRLPAPITRRNLSQVLNWVDQVQPERSPLLQRAVTAHGGQTIPPLAAREQELVSKLERWLAHLATRSEITDHDSAWPLETVASGAGTPAAAMVRGAPEPQGTPRPTRLPPPDDPFNPADFNRLYHR